MKSLVLCLVLTASAFGVFHGGQQKIDAARMRQIQIALRANGYQIQVNGFMDLPTIHALQSLQKSKHWQSRVVPDARALQVLGLGPRITNLMNPEDAALPVGSTILGKGGQYILVEYR